MQRSECGTPMLEQVTFLVNGISMVMYDVDASSTKMAESMRQRRQRDVGPEQDSAGREYDKALVRTLGVCVCGGGIMRQSHSPVHHDGHMRPNTTFACAMGGSPPPFCTWSQHQLRPASSGPKTAPNARE